MLLLAAMPTVSAQPSAYQGWQWDERDLDATPSSSSEGFHTIHRDDWLARDKALHVGVSFLITLSSQYVYQTKIGLTEGEALPLSIGTAASAGLLKEIMDSRRPNAPEFSKRDLVADGVGILLAVGLIAL